MLGSSFNYSAVFLSTKTGPHTITELLLEVVALNTIKPKLKKTSKWISFDIRVLTTGHTAH